MAKKTNRVWVTLEYKFERQDGSKGSERIYVTSKNKKTTTNKLEIRKFSKVAGKHVKFTEAKSK
ncbi:50S ribosomal protein L33 [Candidatus Gracilibacteria bacterium]|jgi:large subunit ribosomal protein L33|nr:50S ribosomal protein L33 [Candidatus Gracilibacteria bacterium]